jgi:hypothetical protein
VGRLAEDGPLGHLAASGYRLSALVLLVMIRSIDAMED